MKWLKFEENDCFAIATYNYQSENPQHMNLRVGDFLCIKEHYPGWYRGFKYTNPCVLKVFPQTHIKLLSNEIHPDLWAEIYSWIDKIREAYLDTDSKDFDQISEAVQLALAEKRFDNNLDKYKMPESNKRTVIQKMEIARKLMGLPIESRNDKGDKIDLKNYSVLDLYAQHQKDYEISRNVSNQFDSVIDNMSIFLKLLRINFEKSQFPDEYIDIVISFYKMEDKNRICRISETYSHRVAMRNYECDLIRANALVTKDIQFIPNQKVFLVFHFIRVGPMCMGRKPKKDDVNYRRPKGVSVLEVSVNASNEDHDTERQIGIQLIQKEESLEVITEQMIHDYRANRREYRSVIYIQLKTIRPDDINDRNIVLLGMNPYYPPPIRNKRNCLYLTLHHAEIDREKKKSDPNIEIEITIRDVNGNEVELPSVDWHKFVVYRSVVYYHVGKPKWTEVVCIPLFEKQSDFNPETHIRFLVWHRSLNDNSKNPRGVAYLKLFPNGSKAILSNKDHDNFHTLSIHKMDMERIKKAEYLNRFSEFDGSLESLSVKYPSQTFTKQMLMGNKKKTTSYKDTLFIQTQLCSTEYTFDDLLANVCCDAGIDQTILHELQTEEIIVKNIDVNEMKKFAAKILESSLKLIQGATNDTYLGGNILLLLGEMFKAIKNLPEYQNQINQFIAETMHFNVHKQILRELINHVPETDSNTLRASDWFMKIIVKSYQNFENGISANEDEAKIFNELVDQYLQKLECWANRKENRILRSIVLSKAGPIINALIPVCQPIGMAKLVNNLLRSCSDLESHTKSTLTMDCMNSKLFTDPQCRMIILPETTKNILDLFNSQLCKIFYGRELDEDQLLDNICERMIEFMQLHERSWHKASSETVHKLVYELTIEHEMLRSCISMVNSGLEFVSKDDPISKLLHRPLMVLVSVIITCLSFLSDQLWERLAKDQSDICQICSATRMTDNFDMIMELFSLISELQINQVYPHHNTLSKDYSGSSNNHISRVVSVISQVVPRSSKIMKQAWMNMLFVQSRQFLATLKQIHTNVLKPYYIASLAQTLRTMQNRLCCCHPSEKMQYQMINDCVNCISSIIEQPFLNIEKLPSSAALRMMQNSKEWDGDIRLSGAVQIKNIWHDLGILKNRFSKTFFNIFAKLTTIQNSKIRILAVECLFDIVHLDPENKKTELITQIDQAMENADSNSSYCEEMKKSFKQVLNSSQCSSNQYTEDSQLVEHIIVQMNNIEECSHHLNDNSPINGMIVINNLRKFYNNMGRSDIIGRYLFKLMKIHEKIKNYSEMGNTLLELSSFYQWTNAQVQDTFLPVDYAECEFQWQLKAKLLEDSLTYFEKDDWEKGIEVCKELIKGYSNFVVDFVKLSAAHSKMSELLKKVMYEDRQEPSWYIVFYLGVGFPKFITDLPQKSIVIRTKRNVNEMSIDLNSQFQSTTVERKYPEPDDYLREDKKIFYIPVRPSKIDIPKKYEGKYVKRRILKYYDNYFISQFVYKRLLNNTEEDHTKRKIEGCVINCDEKLPNILSVVPVTNLTKVLIDPFVEALSDLQHQIEKDEMLYQDYEVADAEKRPTLYQKMKDVFLKYVSPVSGGVVKLVEMVPNTDEYLTKAGDVVTQALYLIYQYLLAFEIFDNLDNYNIFLSEFSNILNTVSTTLDVGAEEFSINTLPDQFVRSRKDIRVVTTIRRPSIAVKVKHEDDGFSTITRRIKNVVDHRPEVISERWSNPLESIGRTSALSDSYNSTSQTQLDIKEPIGMRPLPIDNQVINQSAPPLPPKPNRNASMILPPTIRNEPPPKPRMDHFHSTMQ